MRKTKIIYASSAMLEDDFLKLFKDNKITPGQQAQKFNRLLINGIEMNKTDVLVLSAPPVTNRNSTRQILFLGKKRAGNTVFRYLPIINVRCVKNLLLMISSFFHAFLAAIGRKSAIVCDVLNVSVAMGAVIAGRMLRKPCIGIVTDIPELMATGHTRKQVRYCHKIIHKCTAYVFLTEQMNDILNPKKRPYVVLEGHSDIAMKDVENRIEQKRSPRVCLYAGSLMRVYGIESLVCGFVKANIPNSELHIYGDGDFRKELERLAEENPTVKYMGIAPNSEIVEAELKATLLVNPRPTNEEYTKYSFPSKNMEYMASGTPVLTTKLPGMPQEYNKYVYLLEDESADGVCAALKEILTKPEEELHQKGLDAKNFVMEEKNNCVQAKKVLEMINKNGEFPN